MSALDSQQECAHIHAYPASQADLVVYTALYDDRVFTRDLKQADSVGTRLTRRRWPSSFSVCVQGTPSSSLSPAKAQRYTRVALIQMRNDLIT